MRDVHIKALQRRRRHIQRTQGGAALYPGLSHYAPLGRTIRLRNGVDCALQAIQVLVGYSGWRLPDGFMPKRGVGIDGSLDENRWSYAPTGRKLIAQGKAKRRPGIRYATNFSSPERAKRYHGGTNARCIHKGRATTATSYPTYPGWRCALPWAISFCPFGASGSMVQ
jgi:hypothetical protein